MRPETRYRIANSRAPKILNTQVRLTIAQAIVGKGIMREDTVADLVERHCPDLQAIAAAHGYRVDLDLPENTHDAICKGEMFYVLRRFTTRH